MLDDLKIAWPGLTLLLSFISGSVQGDLTFSLYEVEEFSDGSCVHWSCCTFIL